MGVQLVFDITNNEFTVVRKSFQSDGK